MSDGGGVNRFFVWHAFSRVSHWSWEFVPFSKVGNLSFQKFALEGWSELDEEVESGFQFVKDFIWPVSEFGEVNFIRLVTGIHCSENELLSG